MRLLQKYIIGSVWGLFCCIFCTSIFGAGPSPKIVQKNFDSQFNCTIVPIYTYYTVRTLPWTAEEPVLLQLFFDPVKIEKYDYYFELYHNGESLEQTPLDDDHLSGDFCVSLGNLEPGSYEFKSVFINKRTGKIYTISYPIEILKEGGPRFVDLCFTKFDGDAGTKTSPLFFQGEKFTIQGRFAGVIEPTEEICYTVRLKENPQVCGTAPVSVDNSRFLHTLSIRQPGNYTLIVELENKTKNQKAEYILPFTIVDLPLYHYKKKQETDTWQVVPRKNTK